MYVESNEWQNLDVQLGVIGDDDDAKSGYRDNSDNSGAARLLHLY